MMICDDCGGKFHFTGGFSDQVAHPVYSFVFRTVWYEVYECDGCGDELVFEEDEYSEDDNGWDDDE